MIKPYNTGNPVPSYDPRDLDDNAEILDKLITGTELVVPDRKGIPRKSWAGIENAASGLPAIEAAERAEAAAEAAEAARDAAHNTAGLFPDTAAGILKTDPGEYFFTPSKENAKFTILWLNNAGVAELVQVSPSAGAVQDAIGVAESAAVGVAALRELIRENEGGELYDLTDDLGFLWGVIRQLGFDLPGMAVTPTDAERTSLLDKDGFLIFEDSPEGTSIGPLDVHKTSMPGLWAIDPHGFIWSDLLKPQVSPPAPEPITQSTVPILYGPIVGVQGVPTSLYVRNVLTTRPNTNTILGTVTSLTLPEIQTSDYELKFLTESMGASAYLYLKSEHTDAQRSRLIIPCVSAPNPGTGGGTVLTIGDSIQNRQGTQFQKQYLEGWGYSPVFVGTLEGSAKAEDTEDAGGPLGEAREGWETGDFTYSVTDRVSIVAPGGEADYLALPKSAKWTINPFLRAATGSDSPSIVRNGMVFDPANYQLRFGLATPTVVNITLGTNNVRDRSVAEIYDNAYSDLTLIISQCRSAWPLAKIVLSCPGTARDPARNLLWETKYVPYLRALIQAKKDSGSSSVIVFPVWAHMTQEAGYTITSPEIDPLTNTFTGAFGDTVHPRGSVRIQLQQAYAKMLACAFSNLI